MREGCPLLPNVETCDPGLTGCAQQMWHVYGCEDKGNMGCLDLKSKRGKGKCI